MSDQEPIVLDGEKVYDVYKQVEDARYVYFGLRPRTEGLLGEPCQMPDCPKLACRTLTVQAIETDVTMPIVMCDEHANGFAQESQ